MYDDVSCVLKKGWDNILKWHLILKHLLRQMRKGTIWNPTII